MQVSHSKLSWSRKVSLKYKYLGRTSTLRYRELTVFQKKTITLVSIYLYIDIYNISIYINGKLMVLGVPILKHFRVSLKPCVHRITGMVV